MDLLAGHCEAIAPPLPVPAVAEYSHRFLQVPSSSCLLSWIRSCAFAKYMKEEPTQKK
jgi:hypothetical protein